MAWEECDVCDGTGRDVRDCYNCDGTGTSTYTTSCRFCNGGRYWAPKMREFLTCAQCDGTGVGSETTQTCTVCRGSGETNNMCIACYGKGGYNWPDSPN